MSGTDINGAGKVIPAADNAGGKKKKVCLINGSPRGKKAVSLKFLEDFAERANGFETECFTVGLKTNSPVNTDIIRAMYNADAVVIFFPLYAYTLPGALTRLLEECLAFVPERSDGLAGMKREGVEQSELKNPKVYVLVNCGFAVPSTNDDALRVMELFCLRAGFAWRFGAAIGGGLIVAGTRKVPLINAKLRLAYRKIRNDIRTADKGPLENVSIKPALPKWMMIKMKDSKWAKKYMAKKA